MSDYDPYEKFSIMEFIENATGSLIVSIGEGKFRDQVHRELMIAYQAGISYGKREQARTAATQPTAGGGME